VVFPIRQVQNSAKIVALRFRKLQARFILSYNRTERNLTSSLIPKGILKDIIIVVIGVLIIWLGLRVVFGTENPFYVVSSESMVPELQMFDVLVVQGHEPFNELNNGDIIVFYRPTGTERVIVHRVVAILDDDPRSIRTKGDANPASIPGTDYPITEQEYIGKVAYVVPQIGYITRILQPPINYIIIAVIISIMIIKQISKNRKAKASILDQLSSSNKQDDYKMSENFDELNKIPNDNEYITKNTEIQEIDNDKKNDAESKLDNKKDLQDKKQE